MQKKVIFIATAVLLATASIVAATTVRSVKKLPAHVMKTEKIKKSSNRERTHCFD